MLFQVADTSLMGLEVSKYLPLILIDVVAEMKSMDGSIEDVVLILQQYIEQNGKTKPDI